MSWGYKAKYKQAVNEWNVALDTNAVLIGRLDKETQRRIELERERDVLNTQIESINKSLMQLTQRNSELCRMLFEAIDTGWNSPHELFTDIELLNMGARGFGQVAPSKQRDPHNRDNGD